MASAQLPVADGFTRFLLMRRVTWDWETVGERGEMVPLNWISQDVGATDDVLVGDIAAWAADRGNSQWIGHSMPRRVWAQHAAAALHPAMTVGDTIATGTRIYLLPHGMEPEWGPEGQLKFTFASWMK